MELHLGRFLRALEAQLLARDRSVVAEQILQRVVILFWYWRWRPAQHFRGSASDYGD